MIVLVLNYLNLLLKLNQTNKYIGFGSGKVNEYRVAFGDTANTGQYSKDDTVMVAIDANPDNPYRIKVNNKLYKQELNLAIKAGATLLTAPKRMREYIKPNALPNELPYNIGEIELAEYLQRKGYAETDGNGVWKPIQHEQNQQGHLTQIKVSDDVVHTVPSELVDATHYIGDVVGRLSDINSDIPTKLPKRFKDHLLGLITTYAPSNPNVQVTFVNKGNFDVDVSDVSGRTRGQSIYINTHIPSIDVDLLEVITHEFIHTLVNPVLMHLEQNNPNGLNLIKNIQDFVRQNTVTIKNPPRFLEYFLGNYIQKDGTIKDIGIREVFTIGLTNEAVGRVLAHIPYTRADGTQTNAFKELRALLKDLVAYGEYEQVYGVSNVRNISTRQNHTGTSGSRKQNLGADRAGLSDRATANATSYSSQQGQTTNQVQTEEQPILQKIDVSLEQEKQQIKQQFKNSPNYLKAPNGQDTKLSEDEWLLVRTPKFKAWFGDWENSDAVRRRLTESTHTGVGLDSKPRSSNRDLGEVVSGTKTRTIRATDTRVQKLPEIPINLDPQTLEPRLFYHGSDVGFTRFDIGHANTKDLGWLGRGAYLTTSHITAWSYAKAKTNNKSQGVIGKFFIRADNLVEFNHQDKAKLSQADNNRILTITNQMLDDGYQGSFIQLPNPLGLEIAIFNANDIMDSQGIELDNNQQDNNQHPLGTISSITQVVDELSANDDAKNVFYSLVELLDKFNPQLTFEFVSMPNDGGRYFPVDNVIRLSAENFNKDAKYDDTKLKVINHEIYHALTETGIAKGGKAVDELKAMYQTLKDKAKQRLSDKDYKTWFANINEFVSYGMTEQKLAEFINEHLSDVNKQRTKSGFKAFVSKVLKVFGFKADKRHQNYKAFVDTVIKVMGHYDNDVVVGHWLNQDTNHRPSKFNSSVAEHSNLYPPKYLTCLIKG